MRSDVSLTITLPAEEVDDAIASRDLVALMALDQSIRDSLPVGQEVSQAVALQATKLLQKIARALETITLSDASSGASRTPYRPLQNPSSAQRAEEVKKALKVTQRGQIDTEALARAAAIKARMKGC